MRKRWTAPVFISPEPRPRKFLLKCRRQACFAPKILVSQSRHFQLIIAYLHWQQAAILLHIARYSRHCNLLLVSNLVMIPGSLFLPEQYRYATNLQIAASFATILP